MIYLIYSVAVLAYGLFAGAAYAAADLLGGEDSRPLAAIFWPIALPAMAGFWFVRRLLRMGTDPLLPVARIVDTGEIVSVTGMGKGEASVSRNVLISPQHEAMLIQKGKAHRS
jgi:hypothetical protein